MLYNISHHHPRIRTVELSIIIIRLCFTVHIHSNQCKWACTHDRQRYSFQQSNRVYYRTTTTRKRFSWNLLTIVSLRVNIKLHTAVTHCDSFHTWHEHESWVIWSYSAKYSEHGPMCLGYDQTQTTCVHLTTYIVWMQKHLEASWTAQKDHLIEGIIALLFLAPFSQLR